MTERLKDYALAEAPNGKIVVHRADCPEVRRLAAEGRAVATLFGCSAPPPRHLKRHECLTGGVAGKPATPPA